MSMRQIVCSVSFSLAMALGMSLGGGHRAQGDIITTSPLLPPTTAIDGTPAFVAQTSATYDTSQVGPVILLPPFYHWIFTKPQYFQNGPDQTVTFGSTLSGTALVNNTLIPFNLMGQVSVTTLNYPGTGNGIGTFAEVMNSMDLAGTVAGASVELRADPTQASTGSTTVTDLGGGMFQIHSFFDVFTDISLDSGQTWTPSTGPTLLTLQSVPEPSTWIMLLTAGVLVPSYARWNRRRA